METTHCAYRTGTGKSGGRKPAPDSYRDDKKTGYSTAPSVTGRCEGQDKPAWMALDAWNGYLEINHY